MGYKFIVLKRNEGVAFITLNQPQSENSLTPDMAVELEDACQEIKADRKIKAAVLNGAGIFCGGGEGWGSQRGIETIANLDIPTIATISGKAMGLGLALALSCDLRICSPGALFGIPNLSIPLGGLSQRLPRIVGKSKALEILLCGDAITAEEAYRIGLVNKVEPSPLNLGEEWARKLAKKAPISLRFVKETVHKGLDLTLEQGLRLEGDLYFLLHTTSDRTEGIKAFKEKRPAQFKGE